MNELKVKHFFDASHQLTDSPDLVTKACARLHGHTYAIEVNIVGEQLNGAGMVIDFKAVKQVIDILDHRHINDVFKENGYDKEPTAENMAVFLAEKIQEILPEKTNVASISVCEGYKGQEKASWATYYPEVINEI